MNTTTPRATTRTWQTVSHDRMDGAVVQIRHHTVTLTRTADSITAEVDGRPADVLVADAILRGATFRTVTAEALEAPATIGKPTACELHKTLARLGFKDHYAAAAEALGYPVPSLAALTFDDAATVRSWAYGQWSMVG